MSNPVTLPSPSPRDEVRECPRLSERTPAAQPAERFEQAERFGVAASMLERLDTRPLHRRQRRWWRCW